MSGGLVSFVRGNAFLLAAAALPVAVVAFFLLATAIPRWTTPPPAYDLVFSATGPYDQANPRVSVDFAVRDGTVEATVRPLPDSAYAPSVALFLYDHEASAVRQVPFELPGPMTAQDQPRTVVVEALADRTVIAQAQAPDGYQLRSREPDGPGLVGELFGMGGYRRRVSLVNGGRVVPLELPSPYEFRYQPEPSAVGWIVEEQR